jgi:hypothetical protein
VFRVAAPTPVVLPSLHSGLSLRSSLATGAPAPFASGLRFQGQGGVPEPPLLIVNRYRRPLSLADTSSFRLTIAGDDNG